MSLLEELEKTKESLKEAEEKEAQESEEEQEAPEEKQEDKEEKKEEKQDEGAEEKKKEEEKPDDSGFARMRRENAALKKKNEESAAQIEEILKELAELKKAPAEERDIEEPKSIELPESVQRLVEKDQYEAAGKEYISREAEFKRKNPEAEGLLGSYKINLFHSLRIQNPKMSEDQLVQETNRALLIKASHYLNEGFDPIEEIFHEAKALNLQPLKKQEEEDEQEEEIKPDLKKVAVNRNRNAGTAGAKGNAGQPQITLAQAAALPSGEFAKLSIPEKRRLLYGQ